MSAPYIFSKNQVVAPGPRSGKKGRGSYDHYVYHPSERGWRTSQDLNTAASRRAFLHRRAAVYQVQNNRRHQDEFFRSPQDLRETDWGYLGKKSLIEREAEYLNNHSVLRPLYHNHHPQVYQDGTPKFKGINKDGSLSKRGKNPEGHARPLNAFAQHVREHYATMKARHPDKTPQQLMRVLSLHYHTKRFREEAEEEE